MNILITGAYGFVGTNLSCCLSNRGYILTALDQSKQKSNNYAYFFSWSDFDKIPFDSFDAIIHLAGKAHDTKNKSNASVYFEINTDLTKKIFDAFLHSKAGKFIFFSTVKAAADKVEGDILTEDVIPNPVGPYGESKLAAEKYIQSNFKKVLPSGEDLGGAVYILRPSMIHGPGNKGNLGLLYNVVKKGIPYPLGAFNNRRSFTSIDNLSFVIEQIIEKDIPSGIYNMADDEPLSTNELVKLIASVLNKKSRVWKWSPKFIRFCAYIGTKFHFPLNNDCLQKLTENYVVSNEKIKKALGIPKMPVRAAEGLRKTIQYLANK